MDFVGIGFPTPLVPRILGRCFWISFSGPQQRYCGCCPFGGGVRWKGGLGCRSALSGWCFHVMGLCRRWVFDLRRALWTDPPCEVAIVFRGDGVCGIEQVVFDESAFAGTARRGPEDATILGPGSNIDWVYLGCDGISNDSFLATVDGGMTAMKRKQGP